MVLDTSQERVHPRGMSSLELMYKNLLRTLPKAAATKLLFLEAGIQVRAGKLEVDSVSFLSSIGWVDWAS